MYYDSMQKKVIPGVSQGGPYLLVLVTPVEP